MHKVVGSADEAIRDISDGATIMVGGFGLCGIPDLIFGIRGFPLELATHEVNCSQDRDEDSGASRDYHTLIARPIVKTCTIGNRASSI